MTYEEHLSSTEWNPWMQEKSRQIILAIASVINATVASEPEMPALRDALYNACKIYVHTIEMETRKNLGDAHAKMADDIYRIPGRAAALVDACRATAL